MAEKRRRVEFTGSQGTSLVGRLEVPVGEPRGRVLFAHCFTCSKDLKAMVRISRTLAESGFLVLRFDFTGLGESEGDFAGTDFSSNLEDLVAAADALREISGPPDVLIGHSLGGAAVLAAAERIPDAKVVATIGAPSDTRHLHDQLVAQAPQLASAERATVDVAGRPVQIGKQLVDDLAADHLESRIGDLGRPLLIFHSPVDEYVGIEHARRIYKAARHPKSFVSLDEADHLLLEREEDSRFVAQVLVAWASRYLPRVLSAKTAAAGAGPDQVLVEIGREHYRTRVTSSGHELVADEPTAVGGTDLGPTPYGLLLAALGACKAITVRMYADRKSLPVEAIRVRLDHSKIHARDCEECASETGKVDRIDVGLELDGDLDDDQRRRLLEISERCPVHRTLTSETSVVSSLVED